VWDRLSSGAGTALSVVQDAYGNARDAGSGSGSPGELQDWSSASPRRPPPSVNATSTPSRFEPPPVTQAVRASTFSSVSAGTAVNPWATTSSSPSLPSSSSTSPRDGGRGGMHSVLVDNPWNTARTQVRPGARPPLEDAFAVGGMGAALPPLPQVVDPLGNESSASHNGLPADPTVALPSAPLSASASASPVASVTSTAPHMPSLDARLGISPSSAVGEAPKLEHSGISEEMDPLGVGIR
jgi:hypothetical protein